MQFANLRYGEPGEPSGNGNRSNFTVPGNVAGLISTAILAGVFLVGLPVARWFLAVSVPAGLVVAWVLRRSRS